MEKSDRFELLPAANDPIAYPDSTWASSHHCDICGCADYDQAHKGKGISQFYKDLDNGNVVCEECREMPK